jgi:hypothetical protein
VQPTFQFWLGLSLGYGLDFLLGMLALEREVCYLGWLLVLGFAYGIILSVKVLGGGICVYGWVTILRYCVW